MEARTRLPRCSLSATSTEQQKSRRDSQTTTHSSISAPAHHGFKSVQLCKNLQRKCSLATVRPEQSPLQPHKQRQNELTLDKPLIGNRMEQRPNNTSQQQMQLFSGPKSCNNHIEQRLEQRRSLFASSAERLDRSHSSGKNSGGSVGSGDSCSLSSECCCFCDNNSTYRCCESSTVHNKPPHKLDPSGFWLPLTPTGIVTSKKKVLWVF